MKDFVVDTQDVQVLFLKTQNIHFTGQKFEDFAKECEISYSIYHDRNMSNLERYGNPKTYSQWINGQIIALDNI